MNFHEYPRAISGVENCSLPQSFNYRRAEFVVKDFELYKNVPKRAQETNNKKPSEVYWE